MLRRRADICCLFDLNNSKDMSLYLFILFSHFIALGSMNSIKPERSEERVEEGRNINLTCKYEGAIDNIQWYRQYQRSRPEFLLYITEGGIIHPTDSEFSADINKADKRVDLNIISAAVTDSAVYYCAPLFISVLLAVMCLECRAQQDNVLQPEGDVTAAEGEAVTLDCQYNSSSTDYYLFWYKQDGDNSPKFILSRFKIETGEILKNQDNRLSAEVSGDKTKMHLQISSAAVTDSAVYYCALQPTV
ncbi:uncharacterized protein LOC115577882, partial [Sparus aurata]|uniref:uncharacterized protein LOC115577882 n=1 Tax=Sparus aurata TaxID=8175 RepID=UPI0011C1378E